LNDVYRTDLLAAFSLANLSFIELWDGLLNYTPAQSFFLEHAPPRTAYAAAFANVIVVGLVFFLFIRLARWIGTRYGTAGVIFCSLPILLLIAVPAEKSIIRLLLNRLPVDRTVLIGTLAFLMAATAVIARRRFFRFVSALLVTISPLIPIEAILSVSRCWTQPSAACATDPLASRTPNSLPRVVWIIFDELDYRLAFVDRPSNVPMQAFDRLRATSLFAETAVSPAPDTIPSVPSLLTGKELAAVETPGPAMLLLDGIQARDQPNIFSSVHAMGGNAAAVGWYFPYCRVFSRDLASCSAHDMGNELSATGSQFATAFSLQQQSLFAYGNRSLLGESPTAKHRIDMLNAMHADSLRDVVDPSLNLVFLHFPVPHGPYLYDRFSYKFPKRYLGTGSYLDNLALADIYLGDFRDAMTSAGLWDKTTVIVTSDHPDRMSRAIDGKDDPRVPFFLKMAGQTEGVTYETVLRTVVTKSLIEAILDRQITTSEDAVKWLTAHPE
jgi:hypothetical protein